MPATVSPSILAGARTVETVAAQFARLKVSADELAQAGSASNRGFFLPSEEDCLRHLQISYWQSRNALFELVHQLHTSLHRMGDQRPAAFLVAYAGALVLVDAARFLRQTFDDRPAVIRKLDEPEPAFGIPADIYSTVQKSLTSPVHAWHLYHASRYFAEHRGECDRWRSVPELDRLVTIIDRLESRIGVDLTAYAAARVRVRVREAIETLRRDLLGRALFGLQKAIGNLLSDRYTVPHHHPGLPEAVERQLCSLLQPGDVLVTRKEYVWTNYFLPGYWPHAALYLGDPDTLRRLGVADHDAMKARWTRLLECDPHESGRVIEALKDGVWIRSLRSALNNDGLVVLRPRLDQRLVAEALGRAAVHDGKSYDFDFDFTRSDRLVCTEVVYRAYDGVGDMRFPLTLRAGRLTLAAEDLIAMARRREGFEPAAVYLHGAESLLEGGDMDAALDNCGRSTRD